MKLKRILEGYFNKNWKEEERKSIEEIRTPLIREYMEKVKASFGRKRFSERDIQTVIDHPESEQGIAIIEKYHKYFKENPFYHSLMHIDEIAAINYIHSMLPESRLESYYSGGYLTFERQDLKFDIQSNIFGKPIGIKDRNSSISKSFALEVYEVDFNQLHQTFQGILTLKIKSIVTSEHFSPGEYLDTLQKARSELQTIYLERTVSFPLGDRVNSYTINNDKGLLVSGNNYTEELDKLLTMLNL